MEYTENNQFRFGNMDEVGVGTDMCNVDYFNLKHTMEKHSATMRVFSARMDPLKLWCHGSDTIIRF